MLESPESSDGEEDEEGKDNDNEAEDVNLHVKAFLSQATAFGESKLMFPIFPLLFMMMII